nr:hypothetical protein Iba_chr12cCG14550 [Ipomoea batatas]
MNVCLVLTIHTPMWYKHGQTCPQKINLDWLGIEETKRVPRLTLQCDSLEKNMYENIHMECMLWRLVIVGEVTDDNKLAKLLLGKTCFGVNMDSASSGCDEGYSTDIGVEGSACDMEISHDAGSIGFYYRHSTTQKGRDGVVVLKHVRCHPQHLVLRHHLVPGYELPLPGHTERGVLVRCSLVVDVCPCSVAFLLLPA